jgi:hypothetical protein
MRLTNHVVLQLWDLCTWRMRPWRGLVVPTHACDCKATITVQKSYFAACWLTPPREVGRQDASQTSPQLTIGQDTARIRIYCCCCPDITSKHNHNYFNTAIHCRANAAAQSGTHAASLLVSGWAWATARAMLVCSAYRPSTQDVMRHACWCFSWRAHPYY